MTMAKQSTASHAASATHSIFHRGNVSGKLRPSLGPSQKSSISRLPETLIYLIDAATTFIGIIHTQQSTTHDAFSKNKTLP
jgi:hypothetical protein